MTKQDWQELSKEQQEKWEKLVTRVEVQNQMVQEEYEDLSSGIFRGT